MEEHERLKERDEGDIEDKRTKEKVIIAKMIEKSCQRYKPYEFRPQFIKKREKTENSPTFVI